MSKSQLVKIALSAALSCLALTAGARNAHAGGSTGQCKVYDVSTDSNATRVLLHCYDDSSLYITNEAACPASPAISPSTEQVKLWESMIMAALLAGKKITIWYNDTTDPKMGTACVGHRAITAVYVNNY